MRCNANSLIASALLLIGCSSNSGESPQMQNGMPMGNPAGSTPMTTGGSGAGASVAGTAGLAGAQATAGNAQGGSGGSAGAADVAGNANDAGSAGNATGGIGGNAGAAGAASSTWPAVQDFAALGPFATERDVDTGPDGAYDVFRPSELGAEARLHPIISWANGTLFGIDEYQALLVHWASHGFVVIGSHSNSTAGGGTHQAGIDWLVAQNDLAQSPYFAVLDVQKIGASGHSQGGGATIAVGAGEPEPTGVVTTIPLMPIPNFEEDLTIIGRQLVPMFNIIATEEDRDPLFGDRIYDEINAELVQGSFIGIHEDAMNAAMHGPTLAWFRLQLMGDERARPYFYPEQDCMLCQEPTWEFVRYKNLP